MTDESGTQTWRQFAKLVARVWAEPDFAALLVDNPAKVLSDYNIPVPPGREITVLLPGDQGNLQTAYLVIPDMPESLGELQAKHLEAMVAILDRCDPGDPVSCSTGGGPHWPWK
jgi:hypothetical protein